MWVAAAFAAWRGPKFRPTRIELVSVVPECKHARLMPGRHIRTAGAFSARMGTSASLCPTPQPLLVIVNKPLQPQAAVCHMLLLQQVLLLAVQLHL